jgi:hypothetical protein
MLNLFILLLLPLAFATAESDKYLGVSGAPDFSPAQVDWNSYDLKIRSNGAQGYFVKLALKVHKRDHWPPQIKLPFRWVACDQERMKAGEECPLKHPVPAKVLAMLKLVHLRVGGRVLTCHPEFEALETSKVGVPRLEARGHCRYDLPPTLGSEAEFVLEAENSFQQEHGPTRTFWWLLAPGVSKTSFKHFQVTLDPASAPWSWQRFSLTPKLGSCENCRQSYAFDDSNLAVPENQMLFSTVDFSSSTSGKDSILEAYKSVRNRGLKVRAVSSAETSSHKGLIYNADQMTDGNDATAWCFPVSTPVGSRRVEVTWTFPRATSSACQLKGVLTKAGYRKSFSTFLQNGIPWKVRLSDCGEAKSEPSYFSTAADVLWEWSFLPKVSPTENKICLRLEVEDWIAPDLTKTPADVCISEVVPMLEGCE